MSFAGRPWDSQYSSEEYAQVHGRGVDDEGDGDAVVYRSEPQENDRYHLVQEDGQGRERVPCDDVTDWCVNRAM